MACDYLVIERSLNDFCLCDDFGVDGCAGTATLGTDAVSDTTLVTGARWGTRTGDCGFNFDIDVG